MRNSSPRLVLLSLLTVGLLFAEPAHAQGPGNGGPAPGAATVPIDGGTGLLLAGGVAYALRRLRPRRRC